MLLGSVLAAGVILATGLPVTELLTQRSALAAANAQARALQGENAQLGQQAKSLSDPANIQAIARGEFGLVEPGQQAYDVLPPAGASPGQVSLAGHVPLEGPPVQPGSAQSQALLGADVATAGASGSSPGATGGPGSGPKGSGAHSHSSPGFWSRVGRTLEFWH